MSITTSAQQILGEAGQGEIPDPFWELIERYRGLLMNQATAILGTFEGAEDVVQETFREAFQTPQRLREARSLGACLRMMNKKNALDHLRGKSRDSAKNQRKQQQLPQRAATTGGFTALEMSEFVAQAIEKMPARTRSVLVLRFWEHLGFEDIGRRLKLPTTTVWREFYDGTELLYGKLRGVLEAPEEGHVAAQEREHAAATPPAGEERP